MLRAIKAFDDGQSAYYKKKQQELKLKSQNNPNEKKVKKISTTEYDYYSTCGGPLNWTGEVGQTRWEYYGGKADAKIYVTKPFDLKVLKNDLHIYIESDKEIIDAENKIIYLETTTKYIDYVLKSIQSRGWDIKNAIEWKKFEAGMV